MRITRAAFNLLLNILYFIEQTVESDAVQFSSCRNVHRFKICFWFFKVIPPGVAYFYNECVKLLHTDEEWKAEVCGFIENSSFPTVGA